MSLGPIRPRFLLRIPGTPAEGIARLEEVVARPESRCVSRVLGQHLDIGIEQSERHRWSPCLQMEFEAADDGTRIHGLVGPHPNTWTLFAFLYITLASLTVFGVILGGVQIALEERAWGLWLVPAGILLCVGMYALSQVGQRFAAEQTGHLHALVREAFGAEAMSDGGPAAGADPDSGGSDP